MTPTDTKTPGEGGQITLFHVLVVALSLMLTLGAWQFSLRQMETRTALRFEAETEQAIGLIADRMSKYEDALWAGVAAVDSHRGDVNYTEWKTFAETLRIDTRYPGINGIGVIHFLDAGETDDYLARQRAERPSFDIHPDHGNPERMPITFIEPSDINSAAVGLDVAHETNRRSAALASRDSGRARITGPIVLVQDAGQTAGFLFYAPFYDGPVPGTLEERRERGLGVVYAPFVVHKLMEGLLAKELRDVRFSIRDGDRVIYDEHVEQDPMFDPDPMFEREVSLDLYGRNWTIDMRSDLGFRGENTYAKPTLILVAGLLIEGLIISLLVMMSRANGRAVAYADSVTAELRKEKCKLIETNAQLSQKNAELERFAYVASHDLKTPIRGISGLTEMVEEDLEDYFASSDANPAVAANLGRIRDRVRRMEELTRGIMAISRVDAVFDSGPPLALGTVVADLRRDYDLSPEALRLAGEVPVITVDPVNFRSVVENLIGNAIKYHTGDKPLRVRVTAEVEGQRLKVAVCDNGPGIEPKFHDRIFEVFQTLRREGDPESTGIGLAIVKKAVERHGGTISVTSRPGEGATFAFDWPLSEITGRERPVAAAA